MEPPSASILTSQVEAAPGPLKSLADVSNGAGTDFWVRHETRSMQAGTAVKEVRVTARRV
jgi:hypothetical protein